VAWGGGAEIPAIIGVSTAKRIANSPKWLHIGLRSWQMTKDTTRQQSKSPFFSNNNNSTIENKSIVFPYKPL